MAIKFYKKFSPENSVTLANNIVIKFTTLDHLLGWFATDQVYVQEEFTRFMRENRYGISEVAEKEFHEQYVQKKTSGQTLKPLSREELSGSRRQVSNPVETLGAEAVQAVVGVRTQEAVRIEDLPPGTQAKTPLSATTPEGAFKPPVGKRSARKVR